MACVAVATPTQAIVTGSALTQSGKVDGSKGTKEKGHVVPRAFRPDGTNVKSSSTRTLKKAEKPLENLHAAKFKPSDFASTSSDPYSDKLARGSPLPLLSGRVPFPLRFLWFKDERFHENVVTGETELPACKSEVESGAPASQKSEEGEDEPESCAEKDSVEEETGTQRRKVNVSAEESGRWSPHMLGFHSLWRGLRWQLRAAESAPLAKVESKVSEGAESAVLEASTEGRQAVIPVVVEGPVVIEKTETGTVKINQQKKANLWALSTLLNWRQEQAKVEAAAVKSCGSCAACSSCSGDAVEGVCEGELPKATPEVPRVQVEHSQESFEQFLVHATVRELRTTALMSRLCDLAYEIPELTDRELFRQFHLHLTVTSLELKAAAARELARREAEANKVAGSNQGGGLVSYIASTPSYAFAAAAAVGSYIQPAASLAASYIAPYLQSKHQEEKEHQEALMRGEVVNSERERELQEEQPALINVSSLSEPMATFSLQDSSERDMSDAGSAAEVPDPLPVIVAPLLAESEAPAAESHPQDALVEKVVVVEAQPECPCEWYICDDQESQTRYVIIQGSDSLASWQTNLSFEPVPFECPDLGVQVHKGIYEAAEALYERLLPYVKAHMKSSKGPHPKFRFAGHSLGGSLATLLSLMLQLRGEVPKGYIQPVYTFGSPSIMCGGDHLLEKLGLPLDHVLNVSMHRDIVPRAFACDYPDHVAEVLRRVGAGFRDHPCLLQQRLLYAPLGVLTILQPDQLVAPHHPLLPSGAALWKVNHPEEHPVGPPKTSVSGASRQLVRAAQRAFLNSPHPLEILADPGAYGNEGSISRDHDPRNYTAVLNALLRQETRRYRRMLREERRQWWRSVVGSDSSGDESSEEKAGVMGGLRVSAASARLRPIQRPVTANRRVVGVSSVKHPQKFLLQTWGG